MNKLLENNIFLRRIYFQKSEFDRAIILSCLFSFFMVAARIIYTRELMFIFLLWNLFLAYLPYALPGFLKSQPQWIENKLKFAAVFLLWILILPNSFYIITDLFHLGINDAAPLWFDLALIFSFAWNGLIMGVLSVWEMEKMIRLHRKISNEWLFILPIMFLNALGIYIGRYLRFNSWDVITNPFQLAHDIIYLIIHPLRNRFDWGMIVCFTIFFSIVYLTLKKLGGRLQ
ncbi:MAG TPA: DUF1361 domain-containing protein [Chitinophagaceae bacterium]|nr:DUF1361 domain-containing protein [Chitinophagaceae bacterium]